MLTQNDLIDQVQFDDAVSFGGWAVDLHPAEGVYSDKPSATQWHSKGIYQIPFKSLYSRNIKNLFLGGRLISASHIAFGSTRVMATCASNGQAVGMAAKICNEYNIYPSQFTEKDKVSELQQNLLKAGQFIPGVQLNDPKDLVKESEITASSTLQLSQLKPTDEKVKLTTPAAMLLPMKKGKIPKLSFYFDAEANTQLQIELWIAEKSFNYTTDILLSSQNIEIDKVQNKKIEVDFDTELKKDCYIFVVFHKNENLHIYYSDQRLTGVLSLFQKFNRAVAETSRQTPPPEIGIESFDFWLPQRRPGGKNFAMELDPPLQAFDVENVRNGFQRPYIQSNAWVADLNDPGPQITLNWDKPQNISRLEFSFDSDFDHPMESVLMGHPERAMPFCIKHLQVLDCNDTVKFEIQDNHHSSLSITLDDPIKTPGLKIKFLSTYGAPATLLGIRCYA